MLSYSLEIVAKLSTESSGIFIYPPNINGFFVLNITFLICTTTLASVITAILEMRKSNFKEVHK